MTDHHADERPDVGLKCDKHADQAGEGNRVEEDVSQDDPLLSVKVGRRRRNDNALRVYHFAHYPAGTVGGSHQDGVQAELLGRNPL